MEGQANEMGTKGGRSGANQGSPETVISSSMQSEPPLKAHPGSHVSPSNTVQGEETSQGAVKSGNSRQKFDVTTCKERADGAEAPNGVHPRDPQWKTTV